MTRPPDLTPAELNVMKALWQLGRATVAETRAALTKRDGAELAYTTVMTLLGRLAAKGAVAVDKDREPYIYAPSFRRESILRDRLRSFLSDVFDGDSHAMVLGLVADESLSLDELRAIEKNLGGTAGPTDGAAPRTRSGGAGASAAAHGNATPGAPAHGASASGATASAAATAATGSASAAGAAPAAGVTAAERRRDRKERRS